MIPTVPFGVFVGLGTQFWLNFGAPLVKSWTWGARREARERSKRALRRQGCHFVVLGVQIWGRIGAKIDTKTFVMPGCFCECTFAHIYCHCWRPWAIQNIDILLAGHIKSRFRTFCVDVWFLFLLVSKTAPFSGAFWSQKAAKTRTYI